MSKHLVGAALCSLAFAATASSARGYGYTREDDPLLKAFQAAVQAARAGDLDAARAEVERVRWQTDELAAPDDLGIDFAAALQAAHAADSTPERAIQAWANLVYLGLLQKLHWNMAQGLDDYASCRARLDSAQTYYELALAGNVRRQDEARRQQDAQARSRHEDIIAQFERARRALGSPGLLGVGKRPPDPAEFRAAALRIAGHLNAVFPDFARPKGQGPGEPR